MGKKRDNAPVHHTRENAQRKKSYNQQDSRADFLAFCHLAFFPGFLFFARGWLFGFFTAAAVGFKKAQVKWNQ
jgi:hypothetical protein